MWFLILVIALAAGAAWVAYELNNSKGYPPYQEDMNIKLDQEANWPFPRNRP